jgi:hypothetical protein
MKTLRNAAIAALFAIAASGNANAATEYLVNGSFETGDFTGWSESGSTGLNGVANSFDGYGPQDGSFFVYTGAVGGEDLLSQTFTDAPGQLLSVSGWVAGDGSGPSVVNLYWNNVLVASTGDPVPDQDYTLYQAVVLGTGLDTFAVGSRNDPSYDAMDNFSVHNASGAVPVPAALPLFASGLGVLGLLARRRKKQAA